MQRAPKHDSYRFIAYSLEHPEYGKELFGMDDEMGSAEDVHTLFNELVLADGAQAEVLAVVHDITEEQVIKLYALLERCVQIVETTEHMLHQYLHYQNQ